MTHPGTTVMTASASRAARRVPTTLEIPDVGGERPVPPRAGRNLPAAIGVGLALAAVICGTLFTSRPGFALVIAAAVAVGVWELCRALSHAGVRATAVPLVVGGVATIAAAYLRGAEALLFGLVATVLACFAWRFSDGIPGYLRDVTASAFVAVYVPFLAGFCAMLAAADDGAARVTSFIATTVCCDVGGYAAGVLRGRHPMAPSVSPKKSWEGFAGSAVAAVLAGGLLVSAVMNLPWWQGVLFGLAVLVSATLGDLGESMIKRDIGIKDMGHLLPGHGGLMDRLDSLLPTAPVAWLLLSLFSTPA